MNALALMQTHLHCKQCGLCNPFLLIFLISFGGRGCDATAATGKKSKRGQKLGGGQNDFLKGMEINK